MRLNSWGVFAITLMVFGAPDDRAGERSSLLHVEVMPLMSPEACDLVVEIAEAYLVPTIAGADRVAHVCHSGMHEAELREMQQRAAAGNAKRQGTAASQSQYP